jgi:hypothetical protein
MPSIKKKSKTKSKTKSKKKRKPTTQSSLTKLDPTYDVHKLKGYLEKKMKPWYSKLSEGNLLIIKKNGTYTIISSTTDMLTKWKQSGEDKTIQYILWTTPGMGSSQHMEMFIDYIVETKSNKIIEEMIRSKHTLPILVKHFTKLCSKYPIHTKKDYFLNQYEYPWIQSAKKKEAADIKNKKKLLKKLTKSTLITKKL